MNTNAKSTSAFTLIEMLVVVAIIGILASMLLPSFARAKEKGRVIRCTSNLHQMGVAMKLLVDGNGFRFPPEIVWESDQIHGNTILDKRVVPALGGNDPAPDLLRWYPTAANRPLFPYLKPSEVFRCATDKGQFKTRCPFCDSPNFKPSNWARLGCSYQYNGGKPLVLERGGFRECPNDALYERLEKRKEDWVPSPERFILLYEPAAQIYGCGVHGAEWHQWHYAYTKSDFEDPVYAPRQFISPILCVDGHASTHNFTRALSEDPYFPYEPTKDWVWYKPIRHLPDE